LNYSTNTIDSINSMYTEGIRIRPNRANFLKPLITWLSQVDAEVKAKQDLVDSSSTLLEVDSIDLDYDTLIDDDPLIDVNSALNVSDSSDISSFIDANAEVTDVSSGLKGPFYLMQELQMRKDLYNDNENPLYNANHVPILGNSGLIISNSNRVLNLENIHSKLGWHNQQVSQALYYKPKDLLIYYGWLNSFNSDKNQWNNENVVQDLAKYDILVFGNGLQDPSHGDYSNTQIIISRLKNINSSCLIFGYVSLNQTLVNFQTKVDQWNTLQVNGIFIDEAGYDYGKNRQEFNTAIDYVHGKSVSKIAFANAWNHDHILGIVNDVSYPNSTYNSGNVASKLIETDWVLLESFPVNTDSFVAASGYELKSEWAARGVKAINLRAQFGVNFASSGIINDDNVKGFDLFKFQFISSLMFSLDANGTSDSSYGASSAKTKYWPRQELNGLIYALTPSVFVDNNDNDIYIRNTEKAKLLLDFSTSAQLSSINLKEITGSSIVLSKTYINAKNTGSTNLFIVPKNKIAIVDSAIIIVTSANTITVPPTLGIGIASGEDDIFASTQLIGLTSVSKMYRFCSSGIYSCGLSDDIIKCGIDTAATATTMNILVILIGFLE